LIIVRIVFAYEQTTSEREDLLPEQHGLHTVRSWNGHSLLLAIDQKRYAPNYKRDRERNLLHPSE
jgi:methionine aminopeptidase